MKVLVVGSSGMVGSETVPRLIQRGVAVRGMSRSADKLAALPAGTEGVVADLGQPETLPAAFDGVEAVMLIVTVSPEETAQGLAGVEAAKKAGVQKIVYVSVPIPEGSTHIPHFISKVPVEQAIKASGIDYTILRPNNFYQNDLWIQSALTTYGVYAQPIGGVGLNRVDTRDIADAAANALTGSDFAGGDYELHGPDALTGEETAAIYSRHLDRTIHYAGDDLDAWAQQAGKMMPAWMVDDLRVMYQFFQDHGFRASDEALARQRALIGHEPRSFEDFVVEMAPGWRG